MNRINALRAAVRPIVIFYCTFILGMLVLLEATGQGAVSSGGWARRSSGPS
ncbi:hypothetical protein ES703_27106 [subsurface metagenome]